MDTFISKIHPEELIPDREKEIYDLSKKRHGRLDEVGRNFLRAFLRYP